MKSSEPFISIWRRSLIGEVAEDIVVGDPSGLEILPRFGERDTLIERVVSSANSLVERSSSSRISRHSGFTSAAA